MKKSSKLMTGLAGIVLGSSLFINGCTSDHRLQRPTLDAPIEQWTSYYKSIDKKNISKEESKAIQEWPDNRESIREGFLDAYASKFPEQMSLINRNKYTDKDIIYLHNLIEQIRKEHRNPFFWGLK